MMADAYEEHEQRLRDAVLWAVCLRKDDPAVEAALDRYVALVRARAVVETPRVCAADADDRGWCHMNGRPCLNCQENLKAEAELDRLMEAGNER